MKKIFILLYFLFFIFFLSLPKEIFSQNVGIGTTSPAEKLDVNGNINISGTIKANGAGGQANQVLMTNSSGNLAWGNMCEFKDMITFVTVGSFTWTIPSGVTRIWVEAWGGGGGASNYGGGGGGGYASAIFTVTPGGSLNYTIGNGGNGDAATATNGGTTTVFFSSSSLSAFGGTGNTYTTYGLTSSGGSFSGTGPGYYGIPGETGGTNKFESYILNSTTYRESQTGGKGGDGGNSMYSGGKGSYQLRDPITFTPVYTLYGIDGKMPGGGGGGNLTWGGIVRNGGKGMVIIHY